jgi:hypothetical protein
MYLLGHIYAYLLYLLGRMNSNQRSIVIRALIIVIRARIIVIRALIIIIRALIIVIRALIIIIRALIIVIRLSSAGAIWLPVESRPRHRADVS